MKKKIAIIAVALCLVIALVALCACTPSLKSLKSKYEKNGYTCSDIDMDDWSEEMGEKVSVNYAFYAANEKGDYVTVVSFKDKADADRAEEQFKSVEDSAIGSIVGSLTKITFARKGNAIAYGTKAAVELF